jgi:hypothetical protein
MVAEDEAMTEVDPTIGAEDFGFLAQGVSLAFFFLGQVGNVGDDAAKDSQQSCLVDCESGARVPTNLGLKISHANGHNPTQHNSQQAQSPNLFSNQPMLTL